MSDRNDDKPADSDCIVPSNAIPAEQLGRYSVERDPHREKDIAEYVESQAHDESVRPVERVKNEVILGDVYEM